MLQLCLMLPRLGHCTRCIDPKRLSFDFYLPGMQLLLPPDQTLAEKPSLLPHLLFAFVGCDGDGFGHKCFVICGIKKRRHIAGWRSGGFSCFFECTFSAIIQKSFQRLLQVVRYWIPTSSVLFYYCNVNTNLYWRRKGKKAKQNRSLSAHIYGIWKAHADMGKSPAEAIAFPMSIFEFAFYVKANPGRGCCCCVCVLFMILDFTCGITNLTTPDYEKIRKGQKILEKLNSSLRNTYLYYQLHFYIINVSKIALCYFIYSYSAF